MAVTSSINAALHPSSLPELLGAVDTHQAIQRIDQLPVEDPAPWSPILPSAHLDTINDGITRTRYFWFMWPSLKCSLV